MYRKRINEQKNKKIITQEKLQQLRLYIEALDLDEWRKDLLSQQIYPLSAAVTLSLFHLVLGKYLLSNFIIPDINAFSLMQSEKEYQNLQREVVNVFQELGSYSFSAVCRLVDASLRSKSSMPIETIEMYKAWFTTIKAVLESYIDDLGKPPLNCTKQRSIDFNNLVSISNAYNEMLLNCKKNYPPSVLLQAFFGKLPNKVISRFLIIGIPLMSVLPLQWPIHFGIKKIYLKSRDYFERSSSSIANIRPRDLSDLQPHTLENVVADLRRQNTRLEKNVSIMLWFFRILFFILFYMILFNFNSWPNISLLNMLTSYIFFVNISDVRKIFSRRPSFAEKLSDLENFFHGLKIDGLKIEVQENHSLATSALILSFDKLSPDCISAIAKILKFYGINVLEVSPYLICFGNVKIRSELQENIEKRINQEISFYQQLPAIEEQIKKIALVLKRNYTHNSNYSVFSIDIKGLQKKEIKLVLDNYLAVNQDDYCNYEEPYLQIHMNQCLGEQELENLVSKLSSYHDEYQSAAVSSEDSEWKNTSEKPYELLPKFSFLNGPKENKEKQKQSHILNSEEKQKFNRNNEYVANAILKKP